jgi:hypothetical protein
MAHAEDTHFFTDFGALCGVSPPYRWSMNEGGTTCSECQRLLEDGLRTRPVIFPSKYDEALTRSRFRGSR